MNMEIDEVWRQCGMGAVRFEGRGPRGGFDLIG
jgi:hypothetical protein